MNSLKLWLSENKIDIDIDSDLLVEKVCKQIETQTIDPSPELLEILEQIAIEDDLSKPVLLRYPNESPDDLSKPVLRRHPNESPDDLSKPVLRRHPNESPADLSKPVLRRYRK